MADKVSRKLVQLGLLALFLYPFVPTIYQRLTHRPAPVVTSWLLAWDPLLALVRLPTLGQGVLIVGGPLLIVALSLAVGRSFCGWVCPLGTMLDLGSYLAVWRRRPAKPRRPGRLARALTMPGGNSYLKYYLLLATLVLSFLSLEMVGLFGPLVVFHRMATAVMSNLFALRRPGFELYLSVSFVFLAILGLELVRPRFWCRHLCPLGAMLGWLSRWTLLNRRVSAACNHCAKCRHACPMNAIPKEPHDTDYRECVFCLECEPACPEKAISFGFGALAWARWQARPPELRRLQQLRHQRALAWVRERAASGLLGQLPEATRAIGRLAPSGRRREGTYPGDYVRAERERMERILGLQVGRRGLVGGLATGAVSLALWPVLRHSKPEGLIRPPGALREDAFLSTCIICQECIRVCPAQGLKPAFLHGGVRGLGTPRLVARVGGCQLPRNCEHLCARVCPVAALKVIPRHEMRIGLAIVDRRLCLAWDQAARCLVCVEACPTEAAVTHQGRVTIDPVKCTGCGICEQVCPVRGSAIHVRPENEVRY